MATVSARRRQISVPTARRDRAATALAVAASLLRRHQRAKSYVTLSATTSKRQRLRCLPPTR